MSNNNEANYRPMFTEQELEEIHELEAKGAEKDIHYKIDPGTSSGIIYKQNGIISAFMTMDCFGGEDIESAAIVDNTVIWDEMAKKLIACANERMAKQILFICDPNDLIVTQKLKLKGLVPSFKEYRMVFNIASFSPVPIHDISLRLATQADYAYILKLEKETFDGSADYIASDDINHTQIILQNNHPVGKLRIVEDNGTYGIYGVVVDHRSRGKGIGSQALSLLLNEFIICGVQNIYLEVDSENPSAFHLYTKLGFKVMSEFYYYPYKL